MTKSAHKLRFVIICKNNHIIMKFWHILYSICLYIITLSQKPTKTKITYKGKKREKEKHIETENRNKK